LNQSFHLLSKISNFTSTNNSSNNIDKVKTNTVNKTIQFNLVNNVNGSNKELNDDESFDDEKQFQLENNNDDDDEDLDDEQAIQSVSNHFNDAISIQSSKFSDNDVLSKLHDDVHEEFYQGYYRKTMNENKHIILYLFRSTKYRQQVTNKDSYSGVGDNTLFEDDDDAFSMSDE
jgi:hypothetical protein